LEIETAIEVPRAFASRPADVQLRREWPYTVRAV